MIAEPFMGSGSTVAAAEAVGVRCIGVERHTEYYKAAEAAISRLAATKVNGEETVASASPPSDGLALWE